MSVYTIVASLEGGDLVTLDNDLIFKIYDAADDSLIITTGSHISDVDVTVTAGEVEIIKELGTATAVKVTAVDEAGNESELSDAGTASIILFQDTFTGIVIDEIVNWDLINPDPVIIPFDQNEKIIIDPTASSGPAVDTNYLLSKGSWDIASGTLVFAVDLTLPVTNSATPIIKIGLNPDLPPTVSGGFYVSRKANSLLFTYKGGVSHILTIDASTAHTVKFKFVNGYLTVHIWDGVDTWDLVDDTGLTFTENVMKAYITGNTGFSNQWNEVDNVYISNADYLTQYPS